MLTTFAFLDFGAPELIIILVILLLLFGGKKLPELSKGLGDSLRELRKGLSDDVSATDKDKAKKPSPEDDREDHTSA